MRLKNNKIAIMTKKQSLLFMISLIISLPECVIAKGSPEDEVTSSLETAVSVLGGTTCESSNGEACSDGEQRALKRICNPDVSRCVAKADTSPKITVSDELVNTFKRMGGDPIALKQSLCF